ncbi:MAG: clan AA aspartic protease, partial [Thermoanaerobaculia bacterium]|nr:clan AA aspartic protease [Thermoanaerobaculia bacterium]
IAPLESTEYSAAGERTAGAAVVALSGEVEAHLGIAELPALAFGTLRFEQSAVQVMRSLPRIGEREISGILGFDLLRRAPRVTFVYGPEPELRFGGAIAGKAAATNAAEIPFTLADRHIFLAGTIAGRAVDWVLDTGAKVSLLGPELARGLALAPDPERSIELRGLDGKAVRAPRAEIAELYLGGARFAGVGVHVTDLPVLTAWGIEQRGGILGNDFLGRFAAVEVDFERGVVRFVPQ